MRAGKADELRVPAFPVLTARISETELSKWFPVPFHELTDPQETPEPSKAALIRLEQGEYFVLYWGELSKQLKLEIPAATDPSGFLDAFFREVPLPRGRILGADRARGCLATWPRKPSPPEKAARPPQKQSRDCHLVPRRTAEMPRRRSAGSLRAERVVPSGRHSSGTPASEPSIGRDSPRCWLLVPNPPVGVRSVDGPPL